MTSSKIKGFQLVKKLRLLEDDVQAAKNMRENLMNENDNLQDQIDQIIFQIEEIRANDIKLYDENQETNDNVDETAQATFFGNLNELERQENEINGQTEQFKKQLSDFTHEFATEKQKQKSLREKLQNVQTNYEIQYEITTKAQSDLDVAKEESHKLYEQINELSDSHSEVKAELEKKENMYKYSDDAINNNLKKEKQRLLEEKRALYDKLDKMDANLKKTQDLHDKNVINTGNSIKQKTSVGSWLADRKILLDKIKKKKTVLATEKSSLQREKTMTQNLQSQFKSLFGQTDPGDGSSRLAKLVVQAEIDSIVSEDPSIEEDINSEKDYNATLTEEYNRIMNTLKELERHRNYIINDLNEERIECERKGYLNMLQEELNVLISSASH
ncbi:hypothetical protein TVAG_290530 [Trichomonas vaginalis G3]|uniref:Uncharacterized protein n=1 Tax=Trichomonas vaginalis (strain ATCC PRA-98 / G3) TaxID=412133 RepID=A2EQT7_TRIV3|nr:hypothetical protein TVAGG3_0243510 [Trichomonas vaginalis G3]EAY04983.1 hypothetical protein TVAG_290530 [Trichomonas vaginalis G3]KAI5553507.1 hypothetical protein TVAGG3_0243510 [Trichomonas vaginalis G3]|eukprot:XP_001317206.1 hypothetical protein [Trichomonas vaginalis G3]